MKAVGVGIGLAAACAVAAMAMGATAAYAGVVVLPPTTVYIDPDSFSTITVPGVYHGASDNTALFGHDPTVIASYGGNDGGTESQLTYTIELIGGPPPVGPPNAYDPGVTVGIHMADIATAPANDPYVGRGDALIRISDGPKDALYMENCAFGLFTGCAYGGAFTTTSFASVHNVDLVPYVQYEVLLQADVEEAGYGEVDPTFTAPAGYTLAYSAGVLGGVPEPATWVLMVLGVGMAGGGLRMARRRVVPLAA